nr:chemotaxis protein methyltransferase [uncultured bacterium]
MEISQKLPDRSYRKFSKLIYENCGINLHDGKREMVRARLSKRMRIIGCKNFEEYYRIITEDKSGKELVLMLDTVSTNLTSFFREEKHFKFLSDKTFPEYEKRSCKSLRFWSAGCSSGEEPYSLAIWLYEHLSNLSSYDIKITATDISTKVLSEAEKGIYATNKLEKMPKLQIRKYFQRGYDSQEGYFRIKHHIKEMIDFKRFNLVSTFDFGEYFDLIFCRNVMIYFNKETRKQLIDKFYNSLKQGGYLFVGHAESLTGIDHRFKYVQPSVYRKT